MAAVDLDPDLLGCLSPEALAALSAFRAEKADELSAARQKRDSAEAAAAADFVSEDYGKSQFWYDNATSEMLADEAVAMANEVAAAIAAANGTAASSSSAPIHGAIACVASPSVFRVLAARRLPNRIVLFEFDKRFAALYGDAFSFYDVNHPLSVDRQHVGAFDFVIADPPYLSVDCMSKTGETIALLHRHASLARTIYNTGAILEEAITPALGLRKLVWQPRHASPLSNQFYSFANYPSERLGGYDKPIEAVVRAVAELGVARSADERA